MAVVRLGKTRVVSGVVGKGGGLFAGGSSLSGGGTFAGTSSGQTSQVPTYDPVTNTFTDASGQKSSVAPANVPIGTKTVGVLGATRTSSGGFSFKDSTGKAFEVSPTGVRTEITPTIIPLTPTSPTLQQQSQQPTTLTQQQIQQQIVTPDRRGLIGGLQKFGRLVFDPDAISGGRKVFRKTREKTTEGLKDVSKKIGESEPVELLLKKPGKKAVSGIDIVEKKIRDKLQPKTVEEEVLVRETAQVVDLAKQHEKNTDKRNQDVKKLNKKYGGKELSPEEFAEYNIAKSKIERTDTQLNSTEVFLEQSEIRLKNKEKGLRIQRENAPSQFVTSILVGIATFPIAIAKLGVGVVTKPVTTIKETATGFKDLPKQFKERPISVTGEVVGQVIAGVVAGQVIKTFRTVKGKSVIAETKRIKTATNKALGLGDEIETQTVTAEKQLALKKNFLESGQFADDANVQSIVRTGTIGKSVKVTTSGRKTVKYVIESSSGGKKVTIAFSETAAGKVRGVKLAVTEKGIGKVYRSASPSEVKQPPAPKITDKPSIKIEKINQVKLEGVFAKKAKVTGVKQVQVGEKTLKVYKVETEVFQVGKGSAQTKSIAEALGLDKQPQVVKLLKRPKSVAKVKSVRFEVQKQPTGEIIGKDLLIQRDSLGFEKSVSKFTKPVFEFDIKKVVSKKKPIVDKSIISKEAVSKIIKEVETPSSTPTKLVKVDLKEVLPEALSPQELGFSLRKARPPKVKPPKVDVIEDFSLGDTRFTGLGLTGKIGTDLAGGKIKDLGESSGRIPSGVLDDINIKEIERKTRTIDLNKLQTDVTLRGKQPVKPKVKRRAGTKTRPEPIVDTFGKLFPRTSIDNKDLAKEMRKIGILQKQTQRQKQIQKQILKLSQLQVPIQLQPPRRPRTPLKTITPTIFIPTPRKQEDIFKKLLRKQKKRTIKLKSAYTASLGAAAFQAKPIKVSRKEFERLSKVRFTGIETRPLLEIQEDKKLKKQIKSVQF